MNKISEHQDFVTINDEFEKAKNDKFSDCPWTKFIPIHKDISNGRCPICEQILDEKNNGITIRETASSIDHFRPKGNNYDFLRCEESNYILMCKNCNDGYKESKFPLDTDFIADKIEKLVKEKPLLLNVREENPLDYFELVFTEKYLAYPLLELRIKKSIRDKQNTYEYRKAKETIRFFRLGKCHIDKPKTNKKGLYKSFECRVNTLREHYAVLIDLAKAIRDKKDFEKMLEENPSLLTFGFFQFLINEQFEIEQIN